MGKGSAAIFYMRIWVLNNHYIGPNSTNEPGVVEKVLLSYSLYNQLEVDVVLFSTEPCHIAGVTNLVYPVDLSYDFAYVPRKWFLENLCCLEHDFFMYAANDLVIPETAVLNCIDNTKYLGRFSERMISGFNQGASRRFYHRSDRSPIQ